MSGTLNSEITIATWNMAADKQRNRVDRIAEYLASKDRGVTVLTELTAISELEKSLTRELGQRYTFTSVPTGSPYEDSIGLLITDPDCVLADDIEQVPTNGVKMRFMMGAKLATRLGSMGLLGMRGAYVSGKGGLFTFGSTERKAQYHTAIKAVEELGELSIICGDMNSLPSTHDPILAAGNFKRLSTGHKTWPDSSGMKETTKDALVLSLPFLLSKQGISIDAIYGKSPLVGVTSEIDRTGLSDHLHLQTRVTQRS